MKRFESLGRVLSKNEQMSIKGGCPPTELCEDTGEGCTMTYTGCNNTPEMGLTCDYWEQCPNEGMPHCFMTCAPGDGGACMG